MTPVSLLPPILDPQSCVDPDSPPRRALFLDRDGVINLDHGYVHTPQSTDWMPGIFEMVGDAQAAGLVVVVVTNQAGIARGYYDEHTFREYTLWMHAEFRNRGVPLLATYFCPHHPDPGEGGVATDCDCRKPEPGMILAAIDQLRIDPTQSLMIGDKVSDVEAARRAGLGRAILFEGDFSAHARRDYLRGFEIHQGIRRDRKDA